LPCCLSRQNEVPVVEEPLRKSIRVPLTVPATEKNAVTVYWRLESWSRKWERIEGVNKVKHLRDGMSAEDDDRST